MNDWKHKLMMRLPALVLLAATLLFWGLYDRYEPAGPVLLRSPSMADATRQRGERTETNGCFRLAVVSGGKNASLNFPIPNATAYDRLRVLGRVKVDSIEVGKYPWSCARLLLVQYDENNKWIPGHHGVVALDGTAGWTSCEDIFKLDERTSRVDLVIQQLGKKGVAEFDRLAVEPVRLRVSFFIWQGLCLFLWIAMGVLYFKRCRLHRRRLRVLILLNAVAIIFGVLMPEKWIEGTSDYVVEGTVQMLEKVEAGTAEHRVAQPGSAPKKRELEQEVNRFNERVGGVHGAGHFGLFASLCFLVCLSAALEGQHRSYYFKVAFDILLFAAITESLQFLTLDRTPGFSDLRVDLFGILVAIGLFHLVASTFLRRRRLDQTGRASI